MTAVGEARAIMSRRFPASFARIRAASPQAGDAWARGVRSLDALLRRWLSGLTLQPYSAIALSGLGDGQALRALLDGAPRGCRVYCAEPDPGVAAAFLEREGAAELLADPRFYLGVGEPDDSFFEPMAEFPVLELQDVTTALFAPRYNQAEDYYGRFFLQFARQLEYWRKLWGTNATASGKWQDNTLANTRRLIGAPDLAAFKNAFAGKDMVLASAGPSLDESLDFLRIAQRRAVVVAVNSSFRALRRAGIEPHFVLAADPSQWTDKGFEGVDLGTTVLICPYIVNPSVVKRFEGRVATWSGGNLLATHLRRKAGLGDGTSVLEHGTVSACAFDVAALFGCRSLNLIGQDLALKENGQSHATDTFYSDRGSNRADLSKCRWFPGNTIEKVPVEEKLHVYLKTFEALARQRGGSLILRNASRLGARIEGIPYFSLKALQGKLSPPGDSVAKAWRKVAARCAAAAPTWAAARPEIQALVDFASSIVSQALRGALALEMAEGAGGGDAGLVAAEEAADALRRRFEEFPDYRAILEDGWLKFELLSHSRELRRLSAPEVGESERRKGELLSWLWSVAEGGFRLTGSLDALLTEERVEAQHGEG